MAALWMKAADGRGALGAIAALIPAQDLLLQQMTRFP